MEPNSQTFGQTTSIHEWVIENCLSEVERIFKMKGVFKAFFWLWEKIGHTFFCVFLNEHFA